MLDVFYTKQSKYNRIIYFILLCGVNIWEQKENAHKQSSEKYKASLRILLKETFNLRGTRNAWLMLVGKKSSGRPRRKWAINNNSSKLFLGKYVASVWTELAQDRDWLPFLPNLGRVATLIG
jgi:hypothetical protein